MDIYNITEYVTTKIRRKKVGLIPKDEDLKIKEDVIYLCPSCKETLLGSSIIYKNIPHGVHIFGLSDDSLIPVCPKCKSFAFLGMKEVEEQIE